MSLHLSAGLSRECQVGECDACSEEHRTECECMNGIHEREPEEPW